MKRANPSLLSDFDLSEELTSICANPKDAAKLKKLIEETKAAIAMKLELAPDEEIFWSFARILKRMIGVFRLGPMGPILPVQSMRLIPNHIAGRFLIHKKRKGRICSRDIIAQYPETLIFHICEGNKAAVIVADTHPTVAKIATDAHNCFRRKRPSIFQRKTIDVH